MLHTIKPLPSRRGDGVGAFRLALLSQVPTLLRLIIKDAKSRDPSPEEEGRLWR
jgi:hypothetical protein